jgi:hypothetical protein
MLPQPHDWGEAEDAFSAIAESIEGKDLTSVSEAQTRYDVIDRIIKEVLGWQHGQVFVEEKKSSSSSNPVDQSSEAEVDPASKSEDDNKNRGYVDYILRSADITIVIEAKKIGASFPSPSRNKRLKLGGTVLGSGEISDAISQAVDYAENKDADIVCVTNGHCWCVFTYNQYKSSAKAHVMFPFEVVGDGNRLFNLISEWGIENNSISLIDDDVLIGTPRRLINEVADADGRIGRNAVADHISAALNEALYSDAIINNPDVLEKCFVTTEARTKYDNTLNIYLSDFKPVEVGSAERLRTGKEHGPLAVLLENAVVPNYAPPVTTIIGPVGAGKSTYLKHFELVS